MEVTKDILLQYEEMRQEIKDIRSRIDKDEQLLVKMEEKGYVVSDTVLGTRSDGTIGPIKVTGSPLPEYNRVKDMRKRRIAKLKIKEEELFDMLNAVDDYINAIEKSEIRIIFRFFYLDDLTWYQVAMRMNSLFPKKKYTGESCRKKHDRYLEKNK